MVLDNTREECQCEIWCTTQLGRISRYRQWRESSTGLVSDVSAAPGLHCGVVVPLD